MKSSNGRGNKAPSRHLSPLNETSSASSGLYLRSRCRLNQPCSWRISSGVGGHFTLQLVCEHSCWGVEMQGTWLCQHHWVLDFRESLSSTLGLGKCSLRCVGLNLGYLNLGLTLWLFSMKTSWIFEKTSEIQYQTYLQLCSSWKSNPGLLHLGWWNKRQ